MPDSRRPAPEPVSADPIGGDAGPLPWPAVQQRLIEPRFYWFATTRPDGRPHVRPVLGVVLDGALHTTSSPATRKAKNLAANRHCSVSVSVDHVDVILEGTAEHVTDMTQLHRISDAYAAKYGWPTTPVDGALDAPYGAPTGGPPPYDLYRIEPITVFALGTNEELAPLSTRFRF